MSNLPKREGKVVERKQNSSEIIALNQGEQLGNMPNKVFKIISRPTSASFLIRTSGKEYHSQVGSTSLIKKVEIRITLICSPGNWVEKNGPEKLLPSFDLSWQQLFWVNMMIMGLNQVDIAPTQSIM